MAAASRSRSELIRAYRTTILGASKEFRKKEIFKDLLQRLYGHLPEVAPILDRITAGSEETILNIPRKDKLHRGSADTLFNNIIIEFEADLKKSGPHAIEQLAGYLLGQMRSGQGYNYTLIASDCINWWILAPDVSVIADLENIDEATLATRLNRVQTFTLTDANAEDFYYWIDRYLFKEEKQRATLQKMQDAFGYTSPVFIESFRELTAWFRDAKKFGEVQVSHEQWAKFLSIAYGSFDASDEKFLVHTYLSVFSKLLAYAVVSNDDFVDDKELLGVLDGSIFHQYNLRNFVDNDFFHWVKGLHAFAKLKKVFRLIAQEISTYDFAGVDEDILKGVYQELIDLDTRAALGEYYTPDWLCERTVQEYDFNPEHRILDPSCGSGSFLRAALGRLRMQNPEMDESALAAAVWGIDIHPLSVQIAKTTLLIALGKGVAKARRPIHLNVILANTLLAPEGVANLFGSDFRMTIDTEKLTLSTQVLEDVSLFDDALEVCEETAAQTQGRQLETRTHFEKALRAAHKSGGLTSAIVDGFYEIYKGLKTVKEKGRDSIWKFILQNTYKPYFLRGRFDFIVGNPPWFTYNSVKNETYQDTLNGLAVTYNVKPQRVANFPHLEIAAIFLAYCSDYFLKESGKLAFVLPRSFFSADHHDNTRSGAAKGFRITRIWDLGGVQPLFRIPSCVLFVQKAVVQRKIPAAGVSGLSFVGRLSKHNASWDEAAPRLTEEDTTWFYNKHGAASAFGSKKKKAQNKVNPYKADFRQGATIVPRNFYFVELLGETPTDWEDRVLTVRTADSVKPDAKAPWKGLDLEGRMESPFLYRTAISRSILPYALYKPDLVALPLIVEEKHGLKKQRLLTPDELRREGAIYAASWFKNVENIWNVHRTEKNEAFTATQYLNWQKKATEQNLNAQFLVLYNSSAKDANAAVLNRDNLDLPFIVDHKAYYLATNNIAEAYYLSAILNSSIPNEAMKDFQSQGLFGARDVHKKILDVFFLRFDSTDSTHIALVALSESAHAKAAAFIALNPPIETLGALALGKLRLAIKKHLEGERREMDKLVKKVVG